MICRSLQSLLVSLIVLVPALARADALDVVPDDALAVLLIHEPTTLSEKVQDVATKIGLQAPHAMIMLKTFSGAQKGLDDNGTLAVAVMKPGDNDFNPPLLVFVPVTDYKTFISQLQPDDVEATISEIQIFGERAIVTEVEGYAVFTETHREQLLKNVADADPLVDSLEDSLDWIEDQDVVVIGTKDGIDFVASQARDGLAAARAQMERNPQPGQKAAMASFDMFEEIFSGAQAHVTCIAKGVQVSDEGLIVSLYAGIDPESEWSFEGKKVAGIDSTDDLAAGPYVFAMAFAMNGNSLEWIKPMTRMGYENMQAMPAADGGRQMTDTDIDRLVKANEMMYRHTKESAVVMRPATGDGSLFSNVTGTITTDDSAKYLVDYEAAIKEQKAVFDELKNPLLPSYELESVEIGGAKGFKVVSHLPTPPIEGDAMAAAQEMQLKMLEAMFGPTKAIEMYLVPAGADKVLVSTNRELIAEMLTSGPPKAKLVDEPAVAKTLDLTEDDSLFLAVFDGRELISTIKGFVEKLSPGAIELPEFPAAPPLGVAGGPAPGGAEMRFVLPLDLVKTSVTYGPQLGEAIQAAIMRQIQQHPAAVPQPAQPAVEVPKL